MSLYVHYMNGHLPNAGGMMSQAASFLVALDVLGGEVNSIQSAQRLAEIEKIKNANRGRR